MKTRVNIYQFLILFLALTIQQVNAQKNSFQVEVSGQGDHVILIPGLSCSGDVWQETVSVLQKNYTCHVLTLPGFAGQPALSPMPENYIKK